MGNGWNIITPPNTVRLRSTGPNPHRLDSSRLPDPEPAGVGKAHWVGDTSPHKPPKERRGERERETPTMNWQSSSWCVRLKMYPEKKEECWHFLFLVFFGPFVDRTCTFYP